ncbi:hypothetical protein [Celerinatantimonas sp. MCCC 1A17872]|uniref:hypothetical protein n=1 Tax=Celerinatantimonas sp. MCCC 1A17872 TaxID=3177514 RepID=UPI0038C74147
MDLPELLGLLAKPIDSDLVASFLNKYPSFKVGRPDSAMQYIESKPLGVDLMFRPDDGLQGGKSKDLRKCQSVFFYAQGKDGHEQYAGELPLGFKFSDARSDLLNKAKPQRTWKIGQGEVAIDFTNPSSDHWDQGEMSMSAHYKRTTGAIDYFIVTQKTK